MWKARNISTISLDSRRHILHLYVYEEREVVDLYRFVAEVFRRYVEKL